MKTSYLFFYLLFFAGSSMAQTGVAISTNGNAPHSSAMLDVQSTTKGFLLPRMSQAERIGINNPSPGLLVFDTDAQRLFQYQDGQWRFLIDNSFWAKSATRRWVYNGIDSVGIGTAAPAARLHINNGDLRVSNADINVVNGDIVLNKTGGILQLQDGAEKKGYVQISGDNLRLGTNVGNSNGNVIVRLNGNDMVAINPNGNVNLTVGTVTSTATGAANNLLPVCYGMVDGNGGATLDRGTSNVSVVRLSEGRYEISSPAISSKAIAFFTSHLNPPGVFWTYLNSVNGGKIEVRFYDQETRAPNDTEFSFIIY